MVALLALSACEQQGSSVFSLAVGTCFDDVDAFYEEEGEVASVPVVDCAKPHDNEVYYLFDIQGDEFPGAAQVEQHAIKGCHGAFRDYVGRDYETSRFALTYMTPIKQSWEQQNDREVICFLYDMELAKFEGSARNSGE